jgi:hypothetical protein
MVASPDLPHIGHPLQGYRRSMVASMAGFWENLYASFILAWHGYDPDSFNPRRQETRISLVLRADGKAYLKYLWALQYGVEYWDMTHAIVEGTLNESSNPILIATEDMGRKRKIKLHDDEYEFAAWVWTNQQACNGNWERGRDYEAVRENAAVTLFFGE